MTSGPSRSPDPSPSDGPAADRAPRSSSSVPPFPPADLGGLPTVPGIGPAGGRPIPLVRGGVLARALDVAIAAVVLALTAPIVAIAAVMVTRESRGGAFFRQGRVGLRGHEFEVLKLRTMVSGAEGMGAGLRVEEGDARITRVGAFLRRTSIDELPNLVNVLRGEMAIVGPRPTVAAQVERYTGRQLGRLAVRPGITGLAQVSGRAALPWPERIEIDLHYIATRSLAGDLRIIARTALTVVGGAGLYRGERGGWR